MTNIPAQHEAELNAEEPYNASDPAQVNSARKKGSRLERERLVVVEALMKNKPTRLWLWDMMESCHVHGNPIVEGDPYSTYFNLGQQNAGKRILADVAQFPDLYVEMMKDAKSRR